MAYVKESIVRNIAFEPGHPLAGLEMKTRSSNIRFMANLARIFTDLQAAGQSGIEAGQASNEDMQRVSELIGEAYLEFASKLISWNMQDEEGNEVPPSSAGFASLDDDEFMMGAIKAWLEVVAGVRQDSDLGKDSGGGETSRVQSLPMNAPSVSPAN